MTVIVIIEPHPVLRFGLSQLLTETLSSTEIEGFDYEHLNSASGYGIESDLVLLSVSSTGQSRGQLDAVKRLHVPKAILLLAEPTEISPALYNDQPIIRGLVKKDSTPELLKASVKLILAGGTCFPVQAHRLNNEHPLLSLYEPVKWPPQTEATPQNNDKSEEAKLLGLTPRQYEVLVLLARGYPLKTVGKHLNISVATAKAHTETLYQRLDVHNRNAAVYAAVARGATLGWPNIAAIRQQLCDGKPM